MQGQPVGEVLTDRGQGLLDEVGHGEHRRPGVEVVAVIAQQARPSARDGFALHDRYVSPCPGQVQCGRQAAEPGADDDHRIGRAGHRAHRLGTVLAAW